MKQTKELWRLRFEWARRLADVIDVLEAAGCPKPTDFGLAHLHWGERPNIAMVTFGGGFPTKPADLNKIEVWLTVNDPQSYVSAWRERCLTPAELKNAAPEFVERLKKRLEGP